VTRAIAGFFWSGADDPYPAGPREVRLRRFRGMFFAALWLTPLAGTYSSIFREKVPLPWLAVTGLTAFIVLYLVTILVAFARQASRPSRRDQLLLALTTTIGVGLMIAYADRSTGWWALAIYLTAAGAALYRPPVGVYWLAAVLAFVIVLRVASGEPAGEIAETGFSVLLGGAVVLLMRQAMHLIRELRRTRGELARSAVEQERLRFARDLHDLLGHSLSLIVVKAELTRRLAERDPAAAAQEAAEIEAVGRQALAEVRQTVSGYRALHFDEELRRAKEALADAGIEAVVRVGAEPLPSTSDGNVDDAFAWVVREGTTNVIRHSGATSCVIALSGTRLEIRDDGKGGSVSVRGNGLRGLQERMAAVGGHISINGGNGFTLQASVP
jgi:two-component system, NarL family, sensor histidine kinase DesK